MGKVHSHIRVSVAEQPADKDPYWTCSGPQLLSPKVSSFTDGAEIGKGFSSHLLQGIL
jgi:hypothetical protein